MHYFSTGLQDEETIANVCSLWGLNHRHTVGNLYALTGEGITPIPCIAEVDGASAFAACATGAGSTSGYTKDLFLIALQPHNAP